MHVALVVNSLNAAGAERQATYMTAGLVERGERVTVLEARRGEHFAAAVRAAGGELVTVGARNRVDVVPVVRALRRLRADVVYGLNPDANAFALASGAPAVFGVRVTRLDLMPQDALGRAAIALQHRLARRARLIVANSHAAARELVGLGYPSDRLRVVPNGVDVRRFPAATPAPHDGQLIATAARLAPQKDPETFLRAAALAARPGRRFAWFGVGPLREQVERRAKELGVDLLMPGVRQDMAAAYAEMDVFTLTSAWGEAFSNSFAEALASGLPCVVTDSGDHALAGEVATIVPPRDPAALAAAWDRAAAGDGPAWVRANLGVDRMVARTHELLLEVARES